MIDVKNLRYFANEKAKEDGIKKGYTDIKTLAKPDCKKCFGEGIIGKNIRTKEMIVCKCVNKKISYENKEQRFNNIKFQKTKRG